MKTLFVSIRGLSVLLVQWVARDLSDLKVSRASGGDRENKATGGCPEWSVLLGKRYSKAG